MAVQEKDYRFFEVHVKINGKIAAIDILLLIAPRVVARLSKIGLRSAQKVEPTSTKTDIGNLVESADSYMIQ